MALLRVPHRTRIDFFKRRKISVLGWLLLLVAVSLGVAMGGLNKGMDFRGGSLLELSYQGTSLHWVKQRVPSLIKGEYALQTMGEDRVMIRCDTQPQGISQKITPHFQGKVSLLRMESLGPKMGEELLGKSLKSVCIALFFMLFYIAVRFQWMYGISAVACLVFDCCGVLSFFLLSQKEFNEGAIVALLITICYSINDTVVVFDRVREIQRERALEGRAGDTRALINQSIGDTLPRTLLTSLSTLLALGVLYSFGGSVIREFVAPIGVGFSVGTFSSIVFAAPFLGILIEKFGGKK